MLKLDQCTSAEECLELLAREAVRSAHGWVLAFGARVSAWRDGRWPTREELDRVCGPRACCVMSFDHHSVAANTAAMRAGKLSDTEPDPVGGVVERDSG